MKMMGGGGQNTSLRTDGDDKTKSVGNAFFTDLSLSSIGATPTSPPTPEISLNPSSGKQSEISLNPSKDSKQSDRSWPSIVDPLFYL